MMKLMPSDMNQLAVLDAGCAAGWYTEQFIKLGAQVTAVDISPEEIWNKKESGPVEVAFFRRPLHEILNVTSERFILERIIEPQPIIDFKNKTESLDWYERWFDRLRTNPHFLIVKARKLHN